MATEPRDGYTLDELVREVNAELKRQGLRDATISKRTVYGYVAEGIVPSGGAGPNARYPEWARHQLLFARLVQAQAGGRLSPQQLAEIVRDTPPDTIERIATGREPLKVRLLAAPRIEPDALGAALTRLAASPGDMTSPEWVTLDVSPRLTISLRSPTPRERDELDAIVARLRDAASARKGGG
jgi:hypothetical protein